MWTKKFWTDAAERVIATTVVTLLAGLTGTSMAGEVNWPVVGWTTGLAALGTLAKCVLASRTGDSSSASLVQ